MPVDISSERSNCACEMTLFQRLYILSLTLRLS
uniref:Uncharacterized protein n=1 Tax=Arundo donax TaxID=35708 RepID=A0A0A8Z122_ARUDO